MLKNLFQVKRGITSAKQTLFVLVLLLVAVACMPTHDQGRHLGGNASQSPTAVAVLRAVRTTYAPAVMTQSSTAQSPMATPLSSATATTPGDVTPRRAATSTATPAATNTPRATDTPTPLPSRNEGTIVGFSNGILSFKLSPGFSNSETVQVPVGNPYKLNVYVIRPGLPANTGYLPVADPIGALTAAARDRVDANLMLNDDNTVKGVIFELPAADAAKFPTETNEQAIERAARAQSTPKLTPTPSGFMPTPTPALTPRDVDMPWGKVNLDVPTDQANNYAMGAWCWRGAALVDPQYLSLWATNPTEMLRHNHGVSVFNAEVIGKDAGWSLDAQGKKYFNAYMIERATRSKIDTHRLVLTIFAGAPLATYIRADHRLSDSGKSGGWIPGFFAVPLAASVKDINQIRIGEIYGITGNDFEWPQPLDQVTTRAVAPGSTPLIIYTVPFSWESTCEYWRQQYLNHWQPTPTGGLGPEWDPNEP